MSVAVPKPQRSVLQAPWLSVAIAVVTAVGGAVVLQRALGLDPGYPYKVIALSAVAGLAFGWLAEMHLAGRPFGAANRVTLLRGGVVVLLAGLVGETPAPALGWLAAAATLLVLVLDGVDGRLARAHGTASRFGARFDMETDALLGLVLAVLVWYQDKAAAVVLMAGLLRYAFAAAGALAPALARPLLPSRRRQTVCVLQIAALGACLVPWIARPASDVLAIAVVAAVAVSFALDVRWLLGAPDAAPFRTGSEE